MSTVFTISSVESSLTVTVDPAYTTFNQSTSGVVDELVEDDFIIIPYSCSGCEGFKYRLWFTWYILSMSRDPQVPTQGVDIEMWLAIIAGTNPVGDIWLWQDMDEDYIRQFAPAAVGSLGVRQELSDADWRKARRALQARETRTFSQSPPIRRVATQAPPHLDSSGRACIIAWFIIAGPVRYEHLRHGHSQRLNALIAAWAKSINADWNLTLGYRHYCEVCGVSQWLELWVHTMLLVYSLDELASTPWRSTCKCLETCLDKHQTSPRPALTRQKRRDTHSLALRVLRGLVVSPWPLILWVVFRIMNPTVDDSFQIFLNRLLDESSEDLFTWDDIDESWLFQRLIFVSMPPGEQETSSVPWSNFYPDVWRGYMVELSPAKWQRIHGVTWLESRSRRPDEYDDKLRLAAIFRTFSPASHPTRVKIGEVLLPLGLNSDTFFNATALLDFKAVDILEPRMWNEGPTDFSSGPSLQDWLADCGENNCSIAWHTTQKANILDRIELIHLLDQLPIFQNFAAYVFPLVIQNSPGPALLKFYELVRGWVKWDIYTCLGNYHHILETLFTFLRSAHSRFRSRHIYMCLCQDLSATSARLAIILRDSGTYKSFLRCQGTQAQRLLDLLQDLLDYDAFLPLNPLFSKALIRLSRTSGRHPRCFPLSGLEKIGHRVAAGGFGDIWKGSVGGQSVAVKVMRIFNEEDVEAALKEFGREALIWRQLSHPNLLPFFGLFYLEKRLCLVSPWMDNGNIVDFLKKNYVSDTERISLILDVAVGLEYLHEKYVVHGDLKAINVLVTPSRRACIADFGLCSIVDAMTIRFTHSTASARGGTTRWQAPELLRGERLNHVGSDIYAFGCVCYEVLTGKAPFYEMRNEAAVMFKVLAGERPSRPPSTGKSTSIDNIWILLDGCWAENADSRPMAAQIVQRLSAAPIYAKASRSSMDWDESFTSKFRRSLRLGDYALLPSVSEIERRFLGDGGSSSNPVPSN